MNRLKDKRALITGGTSGIGLETARHFLAEGLASQAVKSDAADIAAQQTLAKTVADAFGELDILCVNAGIVDMRPLEKLDEAAFDRSMAIDFKRPFFLVQALLPAFANPASIVLTTSVNAHIGMPASSVYSASKAALLSLARTLSGELIPRGIRVNAVSPGPVATPLYDKLGLPKEGLKEMSDTLKAQIPVRRFGTPAEIAQTIVCFASDESAYTVGSELIVDGGMSNL